MCPYSILVVFLLIKIIATPDIIHFKRDWLLADRSPAPGELLKDAPGELLKDAPR